ncbi:MAG: AAA family ATPase [Patescibacteria group bacterium]
MDKSKKKIIVIRGPLGVGKSTVARAIAGSLKGHYISIDQVMENHGLDKGEEGSGIPARNFIEGNDFVLQMMAESEGDTHVIDGNFYHQDVLDDLTSRFAGTTKIFTLKASVETCIHRDRERPKSYGEDAARAVYGMISSFDAGTIIQTDDKSESEVAAEIMANLS